MVTEAPPGRGLFITLEGGEGAGKSTLGKALAGELVDRGYEVVLTREPGGVAAAEAIRDLLLSEQPWRWSPLTEVLLFSAARSEHLEQLIRPALRDGKIVICDRFADSTRAYQQAGGADASAIDALETLVVSADMPDLTLLLDLPPEARHARLVQRGVARDAFETRSDDFHERARAAFLAIAEANPDRVIVMNASNSPEQLLKESMEAISARLAVRAS